MGSDWSWTLTLPPDPLSADVVEELLELAEGAGFSPHRSLDGEINGFVGGTGPDAGDHRLVDHDELVEGLVGGTLSTNLWTASEVDVFLGTTPGGAGEGTTVSLGLDSCHTWRSPVPEAEPYRQLHRRLTDLWVALAECTGAVFGRVEDDWSVLQVSRLLADPLSDAAPPPGRLPELMGWWTYFDPGLRRLLPPLPEGIGATVRRTRGGGAVIGLLDDPAAVDPVAFEEIHVWLGGWAATARPAG